MCWRKRKWSIHYHCFLTSNLIPVLRVLGIQNLASLPSSHQGPGGDNGCIPSDVQNADRATWAERIKSLSSNWLKVDLSRSPQLWSWENIGIEFPQMIVSLQLKNQVFIQQSSHTVGLWFIWLSYLPERNNFASSNSCDFSASLIKTPLFHYFLFSHTHHPH